VAETSTVDGETVIVPVPSVPTVTCGAPARVVSVPDDFERSCVVKMEVPETPGAVSPALKPLSP
jgi:hypothetical protein